MVITIKLFAHFRHGRFKEASHPITAGTVCRDIIQSLGFRTSEMGIVLVNGQHAPLDHPLEDADTLALFPLVGGG